MACPRGHGSTDYFAAGFAFFFIAGLGAAAFLAAASLATLCAAAFALMVFRFARVSEDFANVIPAVLGFRLFARFVVMVLYFAQARSILVVCRKCYEDRIPEPVVSTQRERIGDPPRPL